MTAPTIRVHATPRRPYFPDPPGRTFRVERAWSVWVDGLRVAGMYVVDTRHGRTLLQSGSMLTCWHAGMRPGDLARRYYSPDPTMPRRAMPEGDAR